MPPVSVSISVVISSLLLHRLVARDTPDVALETPPEDGRVRVFGDRASAQLRRAVARVEHRAAASTVAGVADFVRNASAPAARASRCRGCAEYTIRLLVG